MRPEDLFKQKSLIDRYLHEFSPRLSAYSFVSLLAWCDFFDFHCKEIDSNLCIFAQDKAGIFLYLKPLGQHISDQAIDYAFKEMKKINGKNRLSRIENLEENDLQLFQNAQFQVQLKSHEYCYYREDIAQFKGNAYKSQRAALNQFVKNYNYQYIPYTHTMKDECLNLFKVWKSQKEEHKIDHDELAQFMLEDNEKVHAQVLDHAAKLSITGRVVLIDGAVKAYTFGYEVNREMFCVLFEITDRKVKGISNFIFNQFCQDPELRKYKFINVMDDFGLPQVNQTKRSYHPVMLLPSYTVLQKI